MVVSWAQKIKSNPSAIADAIIYYSNEYTNAKKDIEISLYKLEREKLGTSHIFEHRLSQLQDLDAILKILNVKESNLRRTLYKKFIETIPNSNIDYLINLDDNVKSLESTINELALIRNLYLGILKGLHIKSASVNLCSRLRKDDLYIVVNYD